MQPFGWKKGDFDLRVILTNVWIYNRAITIGRTSPCLPVNIASILCGRFR